MPHVETPESADLDLVATAQRAHHTVEYLFHNDNRLPLRKLHHLENLLDQLGPRQDRPPLVLDSVDCGIMAWMRIPETAERHPPQTKPSNNVRFSVIFI